MQVKKQRRQISGILLTLFALHLPMLSFAQGGDGLGEIFEFGVLLLNAVIIILYVLPLIAVSSLRSSSGIIFFSILVYLLAVPGIIILGVGFFMALFRDGSREAVEIGVPLFIYFLLTLACFIFTLRKDIAAYKKRKQQRLWVQGL